MGKKSRRKQQRAAAAAASAAISAAGRRNGTPLPPSSGLYDNTGDVGDFPTHQMPADTSNCSALLSLSGVSGVICRCIYLIVFLNSLAAYLGGDIKTLVVMLTGVAVGLPLFVESLAAGVRSPSCVEVFNQMKSVYSSCHRPPPKVHIFSPHFITFVGSAVIRRFPFLFDCAMSGLGFNGWALSSMLAALGEDLLFSWTMRICYNDYSMLFPDDGMVTVLRSDVRCIFSWAGWRELIINIANATKDPTVVFFGHVLIHLANICVALSGGMNPSAGAIGLYLCVHLSPSFLESNRLRRGIWAYGCILFLAELYQALGILGLLGALLSLSLAGLFLSVPKPFFIVGAAAIALEYCGLVRCSLGRCNAAILMHAFPAAVEILLPVFPAFQRVTQATLERWVTDNSMTGENNWSFTRLTCILRSFRTKCSGCGVALTTATRKLCKGCLVCCYCSVECLMLDWNREESSHRENCVKMTSLRLRRVAAVRGVNTCTNLNCPNAIGVSTKRCSGCHLDRYCSVECQAAAYPAHEAWCKQIQAKRAAAGE